MRAPLGPHSQVLSVQRRKRLPLKGREKSAIQPAPISPHPNIRKSHVSLLPVNGSWPPEGATITGCFSGDGNNTSLSMRGSGRTSSGTLGRSTTPGRGGRPGGTSVGGGTIGGLFTTGGGLVPATLHPVWAGLVLPMPWLLSHSYPRFPSRSAFGIWPFGFL